MSEHSGSDSDEGPPPSPHSTCINLIGSREAPSDARARREEYRERKDVPPLPRAGEPWERVRACARRDMSAHCRDRGRLLRARRRLSWPARGLRVQARRTGLGLLPGLRCAGASSARPGPRRTAPGYQNQLEVDSPARRRRPKLGTDSCLGFRSSIALLPMILVRMLY